MNPEPENATPDAESRRFEELAVRYFDGALDDAGLAELNAALTARPELRAAFNAMSLQVLSLAEHGAAVKAGPPVPALQPLKESRRLIPWAVAALVVMAGLTAFLWRPAPVPPSPNDPDNIAATARESGPPAVYVKNADGNVQPVEQWAVSFTDNDPPMNSAQPPDTYIARFGRELPAGWGGELLFNNLPASSEAALRSVPHPNPKGGVNYKVQTPNAWTKGLFTIHDDSWIHVRFRTEKPGFFHALIVARNPDISQRQCVVLEGPPFFRQRAPGQWHTVHLPLAEFLPTDPNRPHDRPLVAFIVVFDSQKVDRGVTIERFWATRGSDTQ